MSAEPLAADVLVLGGGMAGAIAALAARDAGARVVLLRRGPGATALSSGAVSVAPDLWSLPADPLSWRRGPVECARRLAASRPEHPYAVAGAALARLADALAFAARELSEVLAPPLERARFVLTPHGTAVPVALVQRTAEAGDLLQARAPLVVGGFSGHLGWDAGLVASGASRLAPLGGPAVLQIEVDLPDALEHAIARPHALARSLEAAGAAEALGDRLRERLPPGAGAVLLPPVLGLSAVSRVAERIAMRVGVPVAETLSDVPSVPGIRLRDAIEARLAKAGVEILEASIEGGRRPGEVAVAGERAVRAGAWVLATGRFIGGGVLRARGLAEAVLGAPVQAAEGGGGERPAASLTTRDRRAPQPLLSAGVRVDAALRPLDERGEPIDLRLFAAGAVIGGHEQATDGTGLGVAIFTGFLAGRSAAEAAAAGN